MAFILNYQGSCPSCDSDKVERFDTLKEVSARMQEIIAEGSKYLPETAEEFDVFEVKEKLDSTAVLAHNPALD